ncbi:MAG: sigma-54-dependent Fis family transcriptional regulator [Proteobacteria bacterium]|nr:sigma-54-dependent Fis family transcriptional regulator [Pseudomonadota bacterium]
MKAFKPKGFSESIYYQLVENAIPLIVLVQPVKKIDDIANSLIAYTNMQFFKNRDLKREQILTMTFHQLLSAILAEERDVVQYFHNLISKGEITQLRLPMKGTDDASQYVLKGKDGASQYMLIRSKILQNNEGNFYAQGIFTDVTEFTLLANALYSAEEEVSILHRALRNYGGFGDILGGSEKMEKIYSLLHHLAFVDTNVLIQGETGTGKELVARELHRRYRPDSPFVPVNCGALPEGMLESELFGHVRGAFTGASRDYTGLFRSASGGILFLDEIGELSLSFQVKLLRVLQESEVRPVGCDKTIKVDVRVIAATHRDLKDMVRKRTFREDLYYRLSTFPINIPPLRERPEDIILIAIYFLEKRFIKTQRGPKGFYPKALAKLRAYQWPGNIRELENVIEYASVVATSDKIDECDLPEFFNASPGDGMKAGYSSAGLGVEAKEKEPLEEFHTSEKERIFNCLRTHGGNRQKTAAKLNMSRITLWRRMNEYNITEF